MEKAAHLHLPINPQSDKPSGNERKDEHEEHTRQLLFEILRQGGVNIDSETGKKIDDKSDIETLLRVIQNEKKKKEKKHEISSDNTIIKSLEPQTQIQKQQYKFFNEFSHLVYQLNELWLLSIASNPFIRWYWGALAFVLYYHK
jgi:hypothetical protein